MNKLFFPTLITFGIAAGFIGTNFIAGGPAKPTKTAQTRTFDGKKFIQARLRTLRDAMTIDLMIRSVPLKKPQAISKTYPPTPLAIGTIFFFQEPKRYRFVIGKNRPAPFAGDPNKWQRITIVIHRGGDTDLFVQGKKFWSGQYKLPKTVHILKIGRGWANRFWKGQIKYLNVYDGELYSDNFDAGEKLTVQDVTKIYEMPTT